MTQWYCNDIVWQGSSWDIHINWFTLSDHRTWQAGKTPKWKCQLENHRTQWSIVQPCLITFGDYWSNYVKLIGIIHLICSFVGMHLLQWKQNQRTKHSGNLSTHQPEPTPAAPTCSSKKCPVADKPLFPSRNQAWQWEIRKSQKSTKICIEIGNNIFEDFPLLLLIAKG